MGSITVVGVPVARRLRRDRLINLSRLIIHNLCAMLTPWLTLAAATLAFAAPKPGANIHTLSNGYLAREQPAKPAQHLLRKYVAH